MTITTVNAGRKRDGCFLLWGDDEGSLYLTCELPEEFLRALPEDFARELYSEECIDAIVSSVRLELDLASYPDADGGACLFLGDIQ